MVSRFLEWRGTPTCDLDISFNDRSQLQKIRMLAGPTKTEFRIAIWKHHLIAKFIQKFKGTLLVQDSP